MGFLRARCFAGCGDAIHSRVLCGAAPALGFSAGRPRRTALDAAHALGQESHRPIRSRGIGKAEDRAIAAGGRKKGHEATPNPIHGADPYPKLAFEPLPNVTANWTLLTKCREDLDLMWSSDSVSVMRRPGEPKVICRSDLSDTSIFNHHRDAIYSVAWDGEWVWVASASSGLRIITLDGEQVGQLRGRSESDPAPTDRPMVRVPPR